jgi:hypothetical protein
MSTDLGGNCAQRIEAEGRAARSPEVWLLLSVNVRVPCILFAEAVAVLGACPSAWLDPPPLERRATPLTRKCRSQGAGLAWLRENDPLVSHNEFCNTDIRSHLKELFTFTLFLAPSNNSACVLGSACPAFASRTGSESP